MRKDATRATPIVFPLWRAEAREFVRLPRRSPDIAGSWAHEPTHSEEQRLGSLYFVGHIEDVAESERVLLNALALEARRVYYHTPGAPEERFRHTLRHLNTYLRTSVTQSGFVLDASRCHAALAAIADEELYIAQTGSAFSFLLRDGQLVPVSAQHDARKDATRTTQLFTHFVRGTLSVDDIVLLATPHCIDTTVLHTEKRWQPDRLLEELDMHLATHRGGAEETRAAAAIVVQCVAMQTSAQEAAAMPPALPGPLAHLSLSPAGSQSPFHRVLAGMLPLQAEENSETQISIFGKKRQKKHVTETARHRAYMQKLLHGLPYIYLIPYMVCIVIAATVMTDAERTRTRAERQGVLSDRLQRAADIVHRAARMDGKTTQEKRALLAELVNTFTQDTSVATDATREVRAQLQRTIRKLDREETPTGLATLADFTALSIVFKPEVLVSASGTYIVAENNLVQMVRVTPGEAMPRLLITGIPGAKYASAVTRTLEQPPRILLLSKGLLQLFEPTEKLYSELRLAASPFPLESAKFAAGIQDIFFVSPQGPIAQWRFSNDGKTANLRPLLLPKVYRQTQWKAATVLTPSLYLLANDMRLVRITSGKVVDEHALRLTEPIGENIRLVTLPSVKLLALLDGAHNRIVLITPTGNVVKQYRHPLFTDLRDVVLTKQNTLTVLTTHHLLSFVFSIAAE